MSLRETLEAIYAEHNELTPGLLVNLARDPGHPLHSRFEWNDAVAGEHHRQTQARRIIASVKVRYASPTDETRTVKARAYHAIPTPKGSVYKSTEDIINDPFSRRLLQNQMRLDFQAMMVRYKGMDELWDMLRDAYEEHQKSLAA